MPYYLNTQLIRSPSSMTETNSSQVAQQRTLAGTVNRDYFGSNKRIWTLEFNSVNKDDYFTIKSQYNTYLTNFTAQAWEITENNYFINQTYVHVDLLERRFTVKGNSYISDFTLILTEA